MSVPLVMCKNAACKASQFCYRFRAQPAKHNQPYCDFKPLAGATRCGNYLNIPPGATLFEKRDRS